MRFKTQLNNIQTFTSTFALPSSDLPLQPRPPSPHTLAINLATANRCPELTASLTSLGKVCWLRLEDSIVRFTIIPDQGTQVWAQLPVVRPSPLSPHPSLNPQFPGKRNPDPATNKDRTPSSNQTPTPSNPTPAL